MGCGSSAGQVADSRESMFKLEQIYSSHQRQEAIAQGRLYLFGQTRTNRKIIECEAKLSSAKVLSNKTRIPCPNIVMDPLEAYYEQTEETFSLSKYGLTLLPPFNRTLALYLQTNIVFMCGGRDYDHYNVKNDVFFYSVQDAKIMSEMGRGEMGRGSELSPRTLHRPKYSRNRFQRMAYMAQKRYAHMGIYSSKMKSVLVFGGRNEKGEALASCECYSIIENVWKELPAMSVARADGLCFQHAGNVYVFGGRCQLKLSKKIDVYSIEDNQWHLLRFKMHRGIQRALVFSQTANEVLIVGGATHYYACKTVVRVNLEQRSYIWDSELNSQYSHAKGVIAGEDIFIFGGEKDTCQIFNKGKWRLGMFPHRKSVESDELQEFSFTLESLVVKAEPTQQGKQLLSSSDYSVFFGTDEYPCILFVDKSSGRIKKGAVPLVLRLKKNMAVVELPKRVFMLLGGSDRQQKKLSRSCFFYDASTNTALQSLKMSQKKINFAVVYFQDEIYVFGGYDTLKNAGFVGCEKFNLKHQKWEETKSLSRSRYKTFAEVIGQLKIAVFGPEDRNAPVRHIEIYNTRKDYFQTFALKLQIPAKIAMVYGVQATKIIILRENDENFLEEIEITEGELREEEEAEPEKHSIISNISEQLQREQKEGHFGSVAKQQSKYRHEQDYQSSELHKNNVQAMKPRMIEIKPARYDSSSEKIRPGYAEQIRQERQDSSFEVEQIAEENNVMDDHRFDRKMKMSEKEKISEKEMPEEGHFADDLHFGLDSRSFEVNFSALRLRQSVSEKKENLASKKHSNTIQEEKVYKQEKGRRQQLGKPVQGLSKQRYNVVKRQDQIYFFTQADVVIHNIQQKERSRHKIWCENELKLSHIC